jgi:predicted enzyme related to lactoylglutathione lyase
MNAVGGVGRLGELVFDCADPGAQAAFWARVLGAAVAEDRGDWVALEPVGGVVFGFQRVPEPKVAKNRVHVDITVGDVAAGTVTVVGFGATAIGEPIDEGDGRPFQVLADPEGNEFCLIPDE